MGWGCRSHWYRSTRLQDRRGIFRLESSQNQNGSSGYLALITTTLSPCLISSFGMLFFLYMHVGGEIASQSSGLIVLWRGPCLQSRMPQRASGPL
ncbi:hypothetical protein EJ04DRAFT_3493 [Polyplosphaeria fusca]|uniref:Uncharacterized protein n=1 Tax=Polyplosphaeria fusca TaxID=682080 RepID=A0A9P4RAX9_9PLEO|nr:hypothetical protein EJ04DRAFT_3493 [Polyplosphaeria fusca]